MKRVFLFKIIILLGLMLPLWVIAQEEESAEISLEEYTDEFQETFFEALKQKGIENYDKAINALLKCKELDPESHVVDHELAKTYQLNKQMALAQDYAERALMKEPENIWYLNTFVDMMNLNAVDLDEVVKRLPYDNTKLKENLASVLFDKKQYELATRVLKQLKNSAFTADLQARIMDSLERRDNKIDSLPVDGVEKEEDPLNQMVTELQRMLDKGAFEALNTASSEALDAYPLQAFLYYAKGAALNGISEFKDAAEYLTMGLDFVGEDQELMNNMYRELAVAYRGLGDPEKANTYLSKVKNGS